MITRFKIQNFRSIVDAEVALTPINIFIGKNGVGKSNFLSAIQCFKAILFNR